MVTSPAPLLSRDRILVAAVRIADDEGISALTMRRLATELNVHPTSLYNHLPSKDAILDGLVERLFDEMDLGTSYPDWRDWVRGIATSMRRVAQSHRGAFLVLTRRPAMSASALRNTEAALEAFTRAGLSLSVAAEAVSAVSLAMLGLALNECPPLSPAPTVSDHPEIADYPLLTQALSVATSGNDAGWELAIASLIRGLAALTNGTG